MINTIAIGNYRSILNLIIPFGSLSVITGEDASGKSNLCKALRLLSETVPLDFMTPIIWNYKKIWDFRYVWLTSFVGVFVYREQTQSC